MAGFGDAKRSFGRGADPVTGKTGGNRHNGFRLILGHSQIDGLGLWRGGATLDLWERTITILAASVSSTPAST